MIAHIAASLAMQTDSFQEPSAASSMTEWGRVADNIGLPSSKSGLRQRKSVVSGTSAGVIVLWSAVPLAPWTRGSAPAKQTQTSLRYRRRGL